MYDEIEWWNRYVKRKYPFKLLIQSKALKTDLAKKPVARHIGSYFEFAK